MWYSRCYAFACMVAIRVGYRMARGWQILSVECPSSIFFWHVPFFLSFFVLFLFLCSRWTVELCRYSSDLFLSSRPRTTTGITGGDGRSVVHFTVDEHTTNQNRQYNREVLLNYYTTAAAFILFTNINTQQPQLLRRDRYLNLTV